MSVFFLFCPTGMTKMYELSPLHIFNAKFHLYSLMDVVVVVVDIKEGGILNEMLDKKEKKINNVESALNVVVKTFFLICTVLHPLKNHEFLLDSRL